MYHFHLYLINAETDIQRHKPPEETQWKGSNSVAGCVAAEPEVMNNPTLFLQYTDVDSNEDGGEDEDIDCNKLINSTVESSRGHGPGDRSKPVLTTNTRGTCYTRLQENTDS